MTEKRGAGPAEELIVVGVDGSPGGDRAVRWAADEAARLHRPLCLVHVVERRIYEGSSRPIPGLRETLEKTGRRILRRAGELVLEQHEDIPVETRLMHDSVAHAGLRAHAGVAYEIVVGHRGLSGFSEFWLGSTGLHLAGHLTKPVVVVRGVNGGPSDEILAGLDLAANPDGVLAYAFAAATARHARLRVMHVWRPTPLPGGIGFDPGIEAAYRSRLATALAPWRARHPDVKVIEEVRRGHPGETLIGASLDADLLVLGYHPHTGPHLGSVGHNAIHHAHCPVAVVPHPPTAAT